jgi:sugar lactone lactonase YvrE
MKNIKTYVTALGISIAALTYTTAEAQQKVNLQKVFSDNTYQLTGIAVSSKGRVFVNYPLWSATYKYAVVEVLPDGTTKPYPDAAMNSWKNGDDGLKKWVCVQAVYIDDNDYLYVVDPAAPKLGEVYQNSNKVVKINLATNKIEKTYLFKGVTDNHSYLNDIRVDTKQQMAYLTNSGTGGIITLDLKTGKARQLLESHKSVHSDPNFKFLIDGRELKKQGQPVKFNSDGIALTPDGDWLYYKPLTDKKFYRIKTADLNNTALTAQQLGGKVQDLGEVATTDGMIFDKKGNLYIGDLQNYRILKMTPDLKVATWFKDSQLIWPDSYSIANGYLYITTSQIQKQPDYNNGVNKRTVPYMVYKVKLD